MRVRIYYNRSAQCGKKKKKKNTNPVYGVCVCLILARAKTKNKTKNRTLQQEPTLIRARNRKAVCTSLTKRYNTTLFTRIRNQPEKKNSYHKTTEKKNAAKAGASEHAAGPDRTVPYLSSSRRPTLGHHERTPLLGQVALFHGILRYGGPEGGGWAGGRAGHTRSDRTNNTRGRRKQ